MTNTILPQFVYIGGVTLNVKNTDTELNAAGLLSQSYMDKQLLTVLSTLPDELQQRLFCGECAWQLLYAAGLDMDKCNEVYKNVGTALHNTLCDNTFEWCRDFSVAMPTAIIVNGIPYTVSTDYDDYLDAKELMGECAYDDLMIKLHSTLPPTAKQVIACHEMAHALLYEAGYEDMNDEALIQPLGHFLYLFLRNNNFDFLWGCEE